MKNAKNGLTQKMLSIVLALATLGSMMPMSAFTADEPVTHGDDCAYVESVGRRRRR